MPEVKKLTQTPELISIHQKALREFNRIQTAMKDVRQQCINDRRFYSIAGAQWEGKLGEQFKNKPKFEINKIQLSIIKIFNEYRNNRITVDFVSKDGKKDDQLADTCDRLYRADEQNSSAEEAYDNSFEEAVGGGFGAFRLRADYEDEYDEDNEKQRILIEPIYDADTSVWFDLDAKEYDKSDAKCCFVIYAQTIEGFKEKWGEDPASWPKSITSTLYFDWATPNVVYVAEYYCVEEGTESIYIYRTLDGEEEKYKDSDFDNDEGLLERLSAISTILERKRNIKVRKVHKYIMSGNGILEDLGFIAGKYIPIIPVYGKRWFIDNVERCMGHVRLSKDVQRLKNMQTSKLAEISAFSSVEKPILMPEQIAGHQLMWTEDNIKNYPYLLLNPMKDLQGNPVASGPVAYTKVPNIPPPMAKLLQMTDVDMKEILGNQEAGEQITPNLSGKAIELVQTRLDMQTFIYMSNMAKSIKRTGEVWLSMASEIFVEDGRKMKGIGSQDEISSIELMKPVTNVDTGKTEKQNDLTNAKYDVVVSVGPSSNSKREATVRTLTSMLQFTQDPETIQVLTSAALMNMEGENISEIRTYFRNKLLLLGVLKPTEEEAKEIAANKANQPPDANTEFLQGAAEEAQAKAAEARAKTLLTVEKADQSRATTEKTKAETLETLAGVQASEREQAIESAKTVGTLSQETESPKLDFE